MDDKRQAQSLTNVSRETWHDLETYVALLQRWQAAKNLISPDTLPVIWSRHIADCLQILRLAPHARRWVDLGAGAGLPGMVLAIALKGRGHVDLVESRQGKCAFLREAARITEAPATIHCQRIEKFSEHFNQTIDVVTARALAPLPDLLAYAFPLLKTCGKALFFKGQGWQDELTMTQKCWTFDLTIWPSVTDPEGRILELSGLKKL